jgi:DNA polymerase-3 subunit delta'
VRLSLQDAQHAGELAGPEGQALRQAAEGYARAAIAGEMTSARPWTELLEAVRARGTAAGTQLEGRAAAELEMVPRRERKRLETEWTERIRRARRRVQTGALDLGLQVVSLWFADLAALAWDARDLVRNVDRLPMLEADAADGPRAESLRTAIELVEETRERFLLNVSEDLACEALAYRLQDTLQR